MRKYTLIIFMLLFMTVYAHTQNAGNKYYYYYKDEKQFLELNTDFVFVSVTGDESKNATLLRVGDGILKKEGLSDKMKQKLGLSEDFYWTEIEFGENITSTIYDEKLAALRQSANIQIVSPYFKTANNKKIGLTNFFYVKLKTIADVSVLDQYAKQTNSFIVKQDDFMQLWFVLSCTKGSDKNAMELANEFFESGLFQFAEPDFMLEDILNCVNDTYFPQQWGLRNTGQYGGTVGMDIRACEAWNITTGTNIKVAVIDEGIQLNHPDLQANIYSLSYDGENGTSPSIVRGDHATACAGIIGAVGNTAGIRGVAPNCRLMSVSNIMSIKTSNIKQKLANSINWAVQNGAYILSNSWGNDLLNSSLIDDAISNAITNGRSGLGCIVVFSTGNNNGAVLYPANSNPSILAVGAMSQCGQRKSLTSCDTEFQWGSNFGATLDVVAPGVLIPTTDRTANDGYNLNAQKALHPLSGGTLLTTDYADNNYTVWFNGTSSACPHVSGVAALIISVNPALTGQQVRNIIEQTSQKVGGYNYLTITGRPNGTWNNEMGYGLVDALCSVTQAQMYLATLNGPSLICSYGSTYTVNNVPDGCTVSWNGSSNLTYSSTIEDTKLFTANGNGAGWVQATINSASCGQVTLPQKVVWVGPPNNSQISAMVMQGPPAGNQLCLNSYMTIAAGHSAVAAQGVNGYTWGFGNWDTPYFQEFSPAPGPSQSRPIFYLPTGAPTSQVLTISAQNLCYPNTTPPFQKTFYAINCGFSLLFAPNPASDNTEVTLANTDETDNAAYTVKVTNQYGQVMLVDEKSGKRFTLPTSTLKDGVYIIEVVKGKEVYRENLVVKH